MIYELDFSYFFSVSERSETDPDNFWLEVEQNNSIHLVPLKKLDFQRRSDYIYPQELFCRVKNFDENGLPVLTHNVLPYIYELYKTTFEKGESFEVQVAWVPFNPTEEAYSVRDRNGIFFRLSDPDGLLAKGQIIRCRFDKLTPKFFQIRRVDEGARLPFYSPDNILTGGDVPGHIKRFLLYLLRTLPELENIRAELKVKNPLWPVNAARAVLGMLPERFLRSRLKEQNGIYTLIVDALRNALLYLLEGSGFLNAASAEHRMALQQQITEMVELLEPFDNTLKLIKDNRLDVFVEGLLDKLSKSGYLFHPAQQFAALMLIFRLHPEKVAVYLNRIFESIFGRDLENWKREPFRSAFVEQFEIYVKQARREFDAVPLAETGEDKSRLETIITAIALQLLLAENDADLSRSWSLFYRYVSLLRPFNTEALLSKSFLSLMGADLNSRLSYAELKEPMMMMTRATIIPPGDPLQLITTTHRYNNGGVELVISSEGICLRPEGRSDITDCAIPEGVMPWLRPQVNVAKVPGLGGAKMRRLADHNRWWHDIESALWEQRVRTDTPPVERRRADVGDKVYVVMDSVDNSGDNPVFICHIEDPEYLPATGSIPCNNIVGFKLKEVTDYAIRFYDGERGYLATVTDIDNDGRYTFTLRPAVDRFIEDTFNYSDEYLGVITGDFSSREYSSICNLGIGLFLEKDDNPGGYRKGDMVWFRVKYKGTQGQLRGIITRPAGPETPPFAKVDAFRYLLDAIGELDESAREENEAELMRDMDEILTTEHVREIIEILRFKAIAETDLIKAYDILRYARLLSLVIGDESLAGKLATHAALLTQLQFFATNSRIDTEKLEELRPIAADDPMLRLIYHRLEMVSWLARTEKNTELYATAGNPANELEGIIARMVLAYNMVHLSGSDDTEIAASIKQKIMEKLNVNNETKPGKYYGSESKYLEFKTSIVYPAVNSGEDMREAPAEQQFHIMSRIAGLLNANGGRLYLGVNNNGFEVGLHDDFKYFERHPAIAGKHRHRITTLDNMTVFIEDLVNEYFSPAAARKISVSIDNEADKGVIIIDAEESADPVLLDGRLFVRQSGQSTREYHGDDRDDFIRERRELKADRELMRSLVAETSAPSEPEEIQQEEIIPAAKSVQPESVNNESPEPEVPANPAVPTSHWKPNILHEYENGYAEPEGYLYFTGEDELQFSDVDLYLESDENCKLALIVPHDAADGWLILGFDNEKALRIPVSEIIEQGSNTVLHHYSDTPLRFAAIAGKDDYLLCVGADSGDSLWKRATCISAIEPGHISSAPKRFHDAPIHHTVAYEIIDSRAIDLFADSTAEKLGNKRFGTTLRVKENTPDMEYKLTETFKKCAPHN